MTGRLPDESAPDDRALLRAHLEGDTEAFGTLFTYPLWLSIAERWIWHVAGQVQEMREEAEE